VQCQREDANTGKACSLPKKLPDEATIASILSNRPLSAEWINHYLTV
jgi:hypothetical protein